MRRIPIALILLTALAACGAAQEVYERPQMVCRFLDERIHEASGLAASARSDDYFFTHNDSGSPAQLFAVDRKGQTLTAWDLKNGANLDWEDMARGPDEQGRPCLYIGDIGDNLGLRPAVWVYRIPEPPVDSARPAPTGATAPATRFDLRYEDGPRDAEALLVHPRTGQIFIVTKSRDGSGVYAAPRPLRAGQVAVLKKITAIDLTRAVSTSTEPDPRTRALVMGGAFAPDGRRIVVRTYSDAYEWAVAGEDIAATFARPPIAIPLGEAAGGEAITCTRDGSALLVTREGRNAPVHELRRKR